MQSFSQPQKPLTVRLMARLGFRHVPDKTLQIIERHGRYHRAEEGPFVRRNLFSETFGPQIRLGVSLVEQSYDNIISRDGLVYQIRVCVKVFFDLRQAEPNIAPILAKNGFGMVESRVASLVDLALRREVAYLDSIELLAPELPLALEASIKRRLAGMDNMGVSLLELEDGIVVKEILPPARMHENRIEASNIDETISRLARKSSLQVKQALLAHLLRDIGHQRPMFKALNIPEDLNPADDDIPDASSRLLGKPTGRVYDN